MNLNIDLFGGHSIYPIRCGAEQGTGFFISDNVLMTACHVIAPFIDDPESNDIQVCLGNEWVDCTLALNLRRDGNGEDVAILNCSKKNYNGEYLKLLPSSCPEGEILKIIGYPQELGNGIDYFGVDVKTVRHIKDPATGRVDYSRGFDVLCVRKDEFAFSSYSGFSGSPVLNKKGMVVGVITDQFFNSLSFTSISQFSQYLDRFNPNMEGNPDMFDSTSFGLGKSIDHNSKKIKSAGNRYSAKCHSPNVEFESIMKAFCNIGTKESYDNIRAYCKIIYDAIGKIPELRKYIESDWGQWGYNPLGKFINEVSSEDDVLINLADMLDNLLYIEKDDQRLILNPLRYRISEVYNLLSEFIHYSDLRNDIRLLHLMGHAGMGKTHLLCDFISHCQTHAQFYMFWGTDFDHKDPVETIYSILGWDEDALQSLDSEMQQKRRIAIIVIDGINEGSGSYYWKHNLNILKDAVLDLHNVKLLVSHRNLSSDDSFKNLFDSDWMEYEVAGFNNTNEAIKRYFEGYRVKYPLEKAIQIQEFKSPLYLKLYCLAHRNKVLNGIPERRELYALHIDDRNAEFSSLIDVDPMMSLPWLYIEKLAETSTSKFYCDDIPRSDALLIADRICPNRKWSQHLLHILLKDNILKEYNRNEECLIGFEFDNIGDHLKMNCLVKGRDLNKDDETLLFDIEMILARIHLVKNITYTRIVQNVLSELFARWNISNAMWEKILKKDLATTIFLESLNHRKENKEYDSTISDIVGRIIDKNQNIITPRFLIEKYQFLSDAFVKAEHERLLSMPLSERDEKWTIQVNQLSSEYSLIVKAIDNTDESASNRLLIILTWLLTSSFPILRAKLVKSISILLSNQYLDKIISLFDLFKTVNDPYVLQGLLMATYAVIVKKREQTYGTAISNWIIDNLYHDGDAPDDIIVRNWSMKIVEFASVLDKDYDGWRRLLSMMPFKSKKNPFAVNDLHTCEGDEDFFGTSHGAQQIYTSLFAWDFNRYIIGTNNYTHSPIFCFVRDFEKYENSPSQMQSVPLSDISCAIAHIIKNEIGYSDDLAKYDETIGYRGRFENAKERIGKKYQWLALYQVVSYLCDKCRILLDRWGENRRWSEYSFPWYTEYVGHYDPTLPFNEDLSLAADEIFEEIPSELNTLTDADAWLRSVDSLPSFFSKIRDRKDSDWVSLHASDIQSIIVNGKKGSCTVWYDSVFIPDDKSADFETWCKKNENRNQEFNNHGQYEYFWNDYPWSDQYMSSRCESSEWQDAPCEVLNSVECQLQEEFLGSYDEYEILSSAYSPNYDVMTYFNLHNAERGIVRDEKNQIIAINNNPTRSRMNGLFIRKEYLQQYAKDKGKTFYLFIKVRKDIISGYSLDSDIVLNGIWKYDVENDKFIDIISISVFNPYVPQKDLRDNPYEDPIWDEIVRNIKNDIDKVKGEGEGMDNWE